MYWLYMKKAKWYGRAKWWWRVIKDEGLRMKFKLKVSEKGNERGINFS